MIQLTIRALTIVAVTVCMFAAAAIADDFGTDAEEGGQAFYSLGDLNRQPSSDPAVDESATSLIEQFGETELQPIVFQPEPPEIPLDEPAVAPPAGSGGSLFGSRASRDSLLSETRRARLSSNAEIVFGREGKLRVTTDAGNLLGKSTSALGIGVQYRNPITTDTRVRGARPGQFLAAGSYWFPARADLDTILGKIDSRIVDHMVVIKGPYAVRYGPGYHFIDVQMLPTPRYDGDYETHGSTSVDYKTNGEQVYGRQSFWGGSDNWGFRVSYGHRTGNDYDTGGAPPFVFPVTLFPFPDTIPASYNSRDFDVAIGWDATEFRHFEFNYLRLDQSNVEYAGFVHDINFLETDAFELRYTDECPTYADLIEAEGWYNRTNFTGDNRRAGKINQDPIHAANPADTDADAMSTGYRYMTTWGVPTESYFSLGTDLIHLTTELNEIVESFGPVANRLVVPNSRSTGFGFFIERGRAVSDCVDVTLGARIDFISTDAENDFPDLASGAGITQLTDALSVARLDRNYTLWSAFLTARWQLNDNWQISPSVGFAQRPPTLTELYAFGPFIELLPNNTFSTNTQLLGDPRLDPEQATGVDLALEANYPCFRAGLRGFYSFVRDYISFDLLAAQFAVANQVTFVNTDAALGGFELYAERDFSEWLTAFANANYVSGQDLTRDRPSRIGALDFPGQPRSGQFGRQEPLPNVPPLEARVGLRLHEPGDNSRWGLEATARVVNDQGSVAATLFEFPAVGFTIWDLRAYWQVHPNFLLIGGVENLGDKFYREHLDSLAGRAVFQPGASFYFGSEITY